MLVVKNPYYGKEIARLQYASREEIQISLERANFAFRRWVKSTSHERSQLLLEVAAKLEESHLRFAELIRDEAGKPISAALAEVTRCISVLRWAAGEAQRFSGELLRTDTTAAGRPGFGIHTRFPRGPVLGITPFNFPLNLVAHKVAPAIAVGCPILIKPSPATPLTAVAFAELFTEAQAPNGLVQVIMADDNSTAELTQAPEISMVSFTGSAKVGNLIRSQVAHKPLTLELGGNAWVMVLEDIDPSLFPLIAKKITRAAYGFAGQSCISVQNFAAPQSLLVPMLQELEAATLQTPYGDPADPNTVAGPVINEAAAQRIHTAIKKAPTGSKIVSSIKNASPLVISPTLIELPPEYKIDANCAVVQDEIFGPVMTTSSFQNLDEIISRVNSGRYGLQAGVFTQHWPSIEKLYRKLQVGGVVINDVPTTRYDHQPYGGVKDSGQGREGLRYAMEEMTESKFLALSAQITPI